MASYSQNNIDMRLVMYTLAAGTLVAGGAHAAVTESSSSFPLIAENSAVQIDIDGDNVWDVELEALDKQNCLPLPGRAYLNHNGQQDSNGDYGGTLYTNDSNYAGMISDGASVGPGSSFYLYTSFLITCSGGEFPIGTRGFVGVRFPMGQNMHYGYLDVETTEGSMIATVHGACYESTPNTALDVDSCNLADNEGTGPVSVPVGGLIPMSLAVLGLGAFASRRRRRNQQ